MPEFTFDDDVPLPPKPKRAGNFKGGQRKSPYWFIPLGKSYFDPEGTLKKAAAATGVVARRLRKEGFPEAKFECREENGGVRVWRTA